MSVEGLNIVALGGTPRPRSSTEQALAVACDAVRASGAQVALFDGAFMLRLPHYQGASVAGGAEARALIEAVRRADGLLIASPGWHGSISGLVKNAMDYFEELAQDPRAYLDGLPVGLIATAYGWQACGTTLSTLRAIVHALRGWPTPLGAAINCSGPVFDGGACADESVRRQLETVGRQVVEFADVQRAARANSIEPGETIRCHPEP